MKKLTLSLFFAILTLHIQGQTIRVVDISRDPIPGVVVTTGNTTLLTDFKGEAQLNQVCTNSIHLHRLGYVDTIIPCLSPEESTSVIALKYSTDVLNEVSVVHEVEEVDLAEQLTSRIEQAYDLYKETYDSLLAGRVYSEIHVGSSIHTSSVDTLLFNKFTSAFSWSERFGSVVYTHYDPQPVYLYSYFRLSPVELSIQFFPLHPRINTLKTPNPEQITLVALTDSTLLYRVIDSSGNFGRSVLNIDLEYNVKNDYFSHIEYRMYAVADTMGNFTNIDSVVNIPPITFILKYDFKHEADGYYFKSASYSREDQIFDLRDSTKTRTSVYSLWEADETRRVPRRKLHRLKTHEIYFPYYPKMREIFTHPIEN